MKKITGVRRPAGRVVAEPATNAGEDGKWTLVGQDPLVDGEGILSIGEGEGSGVASDPFYAIPGKYDSEEQAVEAALEQLAELKKCHMKDRVFIVSPKSDKREITRPAVASKCRPKH